MRFSFFFHRIFYLGIGCHSTIETIKQYSNSTSTNARAINYSGYKDEKKNSLSLFFFVLAKDAKKFKEKMHKLSTAPHIDTEEFLGSSMQMICSIDPGVFRELDELLRNETRGQGQLELLSLMDVAEGDETFDDLHEEKTDE